MTAIITSESIKSLLVSELLIIRPLLEESQVSETAIDFRLGANFLVSVMGRESLIQASMNDEHGESTKDIRGFYQETRRQLGETFILHPNQTVLATSLEYVKLPDDHLLALYMRSSYARLGLTISTVVHPGYCGCLSIELTNTNKNPINLTIGSRIFQGIMLKTDQTTRYLNTPRKYICNVRPVPSAAGEDNDLIILNRLWKKRNHIGM